MYVHVHVFVHYAGVYIYLLFPSPPSFCPSLQIISETLRLSQNVAVSTSSDGGGREGGRREEEGREEEGGRRREGGGGREEEGGRRREGGGRDGGGVHFGP